MRPILILFAMVQLSGSLRAQASLSLQDAIDSARKSHPLLLAAPDRIATAQGAVTQAGLRPNPRMFFQTEDWRAWGDPGFRPLAETDTYAYITQPFETAGKRTRRLELANASLQRTTLERDLTERQIVGRVKQAYWAAAAAARVHLALVANLDTFQQIIQYHELRVREGALPEADLLRVRVEGDRLALAVNNAALDEQRTSIELFRAMGRTDFAAVKLTDALDAAITPPAADINRALGERLEIKIAREAEAQAAANVNLQQALAKPDIDGVFGYKRVAGFNTLLGGVQVTLPTSNRNQGAIAGAEASVRVAHAETAAIEASVRAEVEFAQRDVAARASQVSGALQRLLTESTESSKIAQAAYREGGADLLRLLDAARVRIETEALYYRTLGEYRQSIVALELALGVAQ